MLLNMLRVQGGTSTHSPTHPPTSPFHPPIHSSTRAPLVFLPNPPTHPPTPPTANPEFLVRSSFHQYQQESAAPALEQQAQELEEEATTIHIQEEEAISEYYGLTTQLQGIQKEMRKFTQDPDVVLSFMKKGYASLSLPTHVSNYCLLPNHPPTHPRLLLQPTHPPTPTPNSRLARIKEGEKDWGWGAVIDYKAVDASRARIGAPGGGGPALGSQALAGGEGWVHVVDVCLRVKKGTGGDTTVPLPYDGAPEYDVRVVGAILPCLEELSAVCIHMSQDLRPMENRVAVGRSLREVERRLGKDGIPLLDPVKDLKITAETFLTLQERATVLEGKVAAHPVHGRADREALYMAYAHKMDVTEKAKLLRREARSHQALVMKDDLKRMKRVLKRLGFIDAENVLQLKGRVACEINTVDELVTTEMIFNGVFNDLRPEQVVALLGCMCFEEKKKEGEQKVREDMEAPFGKLKETARAVGKVVQECKIALDPEEYAEGFNPDMIEVLYAWTLGAKFAEVIKLTDIFEGTIIRIIRRLDEMLRQLASASHAIGDHTLKEKFEEASKAVRRDIVFAASLYL